MITRRSILKSILALPMVARLAAPKPDALPPSGSYLCGVDPANVDTVCIDSTKPPPPMRNIATTHEYSPPPRVFKLLNVLPVTIPKGGIVRVHRGTEIQLADNHCPAAGDMQYEYAMALDTVPPGRYGPFSYDGDALVWLVNP